MRFKQSDKARRFVSRLCLGTRLSAPQGRQAGIATGIAPDADDLAALGNVSELASEYLE